MFNIRDEETIPKLKVVQNAMENFSKLQSTSAISNARYLEPFLVPLALSLTAPMNLFRISNTAISNLHDAKLFSQFLQHFLGVFHPLSRTFTFSSFECWKNALENLGLLFIFSYFNTTTCRSSETFYNNLNHCMSLMSQMLENNPVF